MKQCLVKLPDAPPRSREFFCFMFLDQKHPNNDTPHKLLKAMIDNSIRSGEISIFSTEIAVKIATY
jgi:hypothetical protein